MVPPQRRLLNRYSSRLRFNPLGMWLLSLFHSGCLNNATHSETETAFAYNLYPEKKLYVDFALFHTDKCNMALVLRAKIREQSRYRKGRVEDGMFHYIQHCSTTLIICYL